MSNLIKYKEYHAKIEYSAEDQTFFGRIIGINDTIVFEGETPQELEKMFHDTVDDYLRMCEEHGKEPDKEYKGSFNVRIPPELHKRVALEAEARGISLNQFITDAVKHEAEEERTFNMIARMMVSKQYQMPIFSEIPKIDRKSFSWNERGVHSECLSASWSGITQ